ncbi:MAG TPA: T9SS type A sorting domain-containing protein [Candidatus Acidoferrales bacterium]|nr:T9SS type A sorting domain-containing protein [Candidatus Acidoferrales bacterium]
MWTARWILFVCLATMLQPKLHAQWFSTTGSFGSIITCLAISDTDIFVGTQTGVFLSTNDGLTWTAENSGLPTNFDSGILAVSGDTLFVSEYTDIFRSSNSGSSWNAINFSFTTGASSIAFSGKNIFVGTWGGGGIYRSTDNGENWAPINNGIVIDTTAPQQSVNVLTICGANLYAGTSWGGVYKSTDNGDTWTATGLTKANVLTMIAAPNGSIYAITDFTNLDGIHVGGNILLSTDAGATWTEIDSGLGSNYAMSLAAVRTTPGGMDLFVGTGSRGVFLSTDNGGSWIQSGLPNTWITALAASSDVTGGTKLIAGDFSGAIMGGSGDVFLTTDNGRNWRTSTVNTPVSALTMSPNGVGGADLYADAAMLFLHSSDNGTSWTATGFPKMAFTPPLAIFPSSDGSGGAAIFVGIDSVFHSTDNGTSWRATADSGLNILTGSSISSLAACGTSLFAGLSGNGGIFLSTNYGGSWSPVPGLPRCDVASFVSCSGNQFVATDSGVYLSTDSGNNWLAVNSGLKNLDVNALAVIGGNIFAGTNGNGVFRSTNDGANWIAAGLKTLDVCAFAAVDSSLFAGTSTGGVYLSTDMGAHWNPVNSGLTNSVINALIQNGKNIFAGTGSGIWRRPLSEMITSVNERTQLPASFALFQNYPNPFNPSTTIGYDLPSNSFVSLKIYDVLGREVETLVNERQAAGSHSVTFNASNLPSGVYFYRLQVIDPVRGTGSYTATKKLLLLK